MFDFYKRICYDREKDAGEKDLRIHKAELLENFGRGDKLNILLVAEAYYPLIGGATVVVDNLAKEYAKFANIVVVTGDCKYEDRAEYPVIRCTGLTFDKDNGTAAFPKLDRKFRRLIKSLPLDAVHIHSYFGLAKFGLRLAKKKGIPAVVHGHSKFYDEYITIVRFKWLAKILHRRAIRLLNRADEVFAVSELLANVYRSSGCRTPVRVVRNATEFEYLPPEKADAVLREAGIPKHTNTLLFLGRIAANYKNLDFLIESLKIAAERGTDYFMLVVGDGPDLVRIKRYVKDAGLSDRFLFTGAVSDRTTREALYQMSDLFLFPSVRDTSGLVKFEAGTQGTPTLCIAGSAVSEEIIDGVNGYCAPEDPGLYAGKIQEILSDPAGLARVSEKAKETLSLHWEDTAKACAEEFRTLAKQAK